jgi:hypothetical protein
MLIKCNFKQKIIEGVLEDCAINWIKGNKRRRKLSGVIRILFEEGSLSFLPYHLQVRWVENTEKEEKENEIEIPEVKSSSLYYVNKEEENDNYIFLKMEGKKETLIKKNKRKGEHILDIMHFQDENEEQVVVTKSNRKNKKKKMEDYYYYD